jgi:gamma-aminobutyric acid type B receptor
MVVGILLMIDVAIMTTWQVTDPFYRETKKLEPYVSTKQMLIGGRVFDVFTLQAHPSSADIVIIPENEYCQSNKMTLFIGSIYAYKGLLLASTKSTCMGAWHYIASTIRTHSNI